MISPSIRSHFVRIKHALTVFAYAPYPGVKSRISTTMRVCVCVWGGFALTGEAPSLVPVFRPKPRRFPPPKINVCESICAPVCVSRFCKTNLSSMRRFSVIEPGFDHLATVNNARQATAHLQHRMLVLVCVECARACDRTVLFPSCKCNRAVLRRSSAWPS